MAGPPVYEDGLFDLSTDLSYNSLDNTFKVSYQGPRRGVLTMNREMYKNNS
jgi:hypothetical protein